MSIASRLKQLLRNSQTDDRPDAAPLPDGLVLLCRPEGEAEAGMFRGHPRTRRHPSLIKNRDPLSARSGGMGPAWAYELWVLRKDLRRARESLSLPTRRECLTGGAHRGAARAPRRTSCSSLLGSASSSPRFSLLEPATSRPDGTRSLVKEHARSREADASPAAANPMPRRAAHATAARALARRLQGGGCRAGRARACDTAHRPRDTTPLRCSCRLPAARCSLAREAS